MIYCVHCGAANPQEARFCYRCGQPIVPAPAALSEPPPPPPLPQTNPFSPNNLAVSPGYTRAGPELVKYHPLAEGILGFPYELQSLPREFYSYVDAGERLIFARRGGFWKRFLAVVVDFFVLLVPLFVFAYVDAVAGNKVKTNPDGTAFARVDVNTTNPQVTFLILIVILAYFFLTGVLWNGQSIGKRTLKLRVMRLDGRKPDLLTAAVRYLAGYLISANILGLTVIVLIAAGLGLNTTVSGFIGLFFFGWGFWWAGWDSLKQGWHDKLARTLVVDTREYIEGVHFFRDSKS